MRTTDESIYHMPEEGIVFGARVRNEFGMNKVGGPEHGEDTIFVKIAPDIQGKVAEVREVNWFRGIFVGVGRAAEL